MKFVCQQADLNSSLSLVSRAVPSKPSQPILTNIKLEANDQLQQIRLTGFDTSLGIQTSFAAEVSEAGVIAIPAKFLTDIVSRLPSGTISIDDTSQNGDSILVTLQSATGTYQMRGLNAEDYPELPTQEQSEVRQLPSIALMEGLKGALIACSQDETKQILTGVNLKVDDEKLEFAATDGHRLSVVEAYPENIDGSGAESAKSLELTVPARGLRELEKMLAAKPATTEVGLHLGEGQVIFEWQNNQGHQQLTTRTLEGKYPDYRMLIPQRFSKQVTIDRKQLVSSLERIAVLADQHNNLVKFIISNSKQSLYLSVEAQDIGTGKESLPAQISGEDMEIAFNVRYLLDGLKTMNTQEISINLNGVLEQVIFSPLGGIKMTYLVMPVQLRN